MKPQKKTKKNSPIQGPSDIQTVAFFTQFVMFLDEHENVSNHLVAGACLGEARLRMVKIGLTKAEARRVFNEMLNMTKWKEE